VKVAGDPSQAKLAKRRPRLRAAQGAESVPYPESAPEREALIDEGIALLGPRYGRAVGREEARQMIERLTAFFNILAEWQDRAQAGPGEGDVAA
jgi:hypothetical protein